MKKSTKLLSVILAIVMLFSTMSVMASAAKASYQTVDNLNSLNAYSPYGTVTRLDTETRLSIVCDSLDLLLAQANINMGTVVDVLGLTVTINLTSINNVCVSLDSFKNTMNGFTWKLAKGIVNLGILEELSFSTWDTGLNRENYDHTRIVQELLDLLSNNTGAIDSVLTNGIQLGIVANFISGLDLTEINSMVTNIPGAINGLVYPLFSRPDDNADTRKIYSEKTQSLETTVNNFVNGLFTKPMNWTSYRVDVNGSDLGYTTALPTTEETSRYFVFNADGSITQKDYQYKNDNKELIGTWTDTVTYTMAKEFDSEDCTTYVYRAPAGYSGDATLKWYKSDDFVTEGGVKQSGYWLKDVKEALESGSLSLNLNGDDTVVSLLYSFIPYVFKAMAPTVLNGSVKKLLAEAFDVEFGFIGSKGTDELAAAIADVQDKSFFESEQEFYLWEYTNYKVIDGVPYYRYQDKFYKGNIPSNISTYYSMFNWDYVITDDFVNEFIPSPNGSASAAGYNTILEGLNKFVYKVLNTVLVESFTLKDGTTYNLRAEMKWQDGDNDLALDNLLSAARAVFRIAPTEMFDEYYNDPDFSPYYNMMMNGTLKQAITGLLCALVDMLVPQAILPKEDKLCVEVGTDNDADVPFIAVGAVLVRELCTQLMPSYDFDALIYANDGYNTKTLLTGADYGPDYWLDTVLLMGVDLGMYYLRNITDLGEDDASKGYFGAMKNLKAAPNADANERVYAAGATYINGVPNWQYKVDWVIDWALTSDVLWGWNMGKLVDCGSNVSLSTYENPWSKLNTVLLKLLPFNQLLNEANANSASGTFLENVLRDKFVGAIINLDLPKLVSTFNIPNGCFRSTNILDQVVILVRDLLNNLLYKVAGNTNIVPDAISSISTLLNQGNIKTTALNLVGALDNAGNNGLLVPVLPILNMFVGWTTDPQKYAEPSIYISTGWNDNYLNSGCENNIMFINTSSGMLQKHRNSSTVDHAYDINVSKVETDVADCSVNGWPTTVGPGETAPLKINLPANDGVVKFTITYSYVGKDGQPLGGEQVMSVYEYVSHTDDQENVKVAAADTSDYSQRDEYKTYVFTENLYSSVTEYTGSITYVKGGGLGYISNRTKEFKQCGKIDTAFDSRASQYFQPITDRVEAGWLTKVEYDNEDYTTSVGKLYKAKAGVTEETFSEKNSKDNNLYGVYNMGQVATQYGNKGYGTWAVQFIYYNDYDIGTVMEKYEKMNLQASDYTAEGASAFTTYENALKEVVKLATYPKMTNYCDVVQPNIKGAVEALDNAYKALEEYRIVNGTANANAIDTVKDALAEIETDPTRDLNFQDHALFEYFQYEKQRTSARAMINACTPPAEPQKFIEGEGVSPAIIDAIIANAVSAEQGLGITATVTEPTADDINNWKTAKANFVAPNYTDLQIEDQAAKIRYYANFMIANAKVADHTFLDREIAAAQAQGYVEADYSKDSWAAYKTALDNAIAVNAASDSLESRIFDAKYELMKAQNNLIPADASMKQDGYLDVELKGLIANAEAILNHFNEYYKVKDGVNANDAWAQLVKALGVRYNVEVDGKEQSGILYNHSAYTFVDYDRLNTVKEKIKVDRACEKLAEALKNFECTIVVEPEENDKVITNVEQTEKVIQGIAPGSLATSENVLAHIAANDPAATLVVTASVNGGYGTGAKVDVQVTIGNEVKTLTTYNVIVYGDVNGDSAIDAFDMFSVDKNATSVEVLLGIYQTAGDVDGNGVVDNADYGMIKNETVTAGTINQVA